MPGRGRGSFWGEIGCVSHLKELFGRPVIKSSIGYFGLFSQIIRRLNGCKHSLYCQEGCKVGRVGGYDDESEKPPNAPNYSARHGPGTE